MLRTDPAGRRQSSASYRLRSRRIKLITKADLRQGWGTGYTAESLVAEAREISRVNKHRNKLFAVVSFDLCLSELGLVRSLSVAIQTDFLVL